MLSFRSRLPSVPGSLGASNKGFLDSEIGLTPLNQTNVGQFNNKNIDNNQTTAPPPPPPPPPPSSPISTVAHSLMPKPIQKAEQQVEHILMDIDNNILKQLDNETQNTPKTMHYLLYTLHVVCIILKYGVFGLFFMISLLALSLHFTTSYDDITNYTLCVLTDRPQFCYSNNTTTRIIDDIQPTSSNLISSLHYTNADDNSDTLPINGIIHTAENVSNKSAARSQALRFRPTRDPKSLQVVTKSVELLKQRSIDEDHEGDENYAFIYKMVSQKYPNSEIHSLIGGHSYAITIKNRNPNDSALERKLVVDDLTDILNQEYPVINVYETSVPYQFVANLYELTPLNDDLSQN